MSGTQQQRLAVFPTRMALSGLKIRLRGAQTGHSLLKRKSEALTKRFRAIVSRLERVRQRLADTLQSAAFTLTEVSFAAGPTVDFPFAVRNSVSTATLQVTSRIDNISGVLLPSFTAHSQHPSVTAALRAAAAAAALVDNDSVAAHDKNSPSAAAAAAAAAEADAAMASAASTRGAFMELAGLMRGAPQIARARDAYLRAVALAIELASLQASHALLDEVIRATNRRVNAIECVVVPRIENSIKYVISELDEEDREEFFRLKKVQAKKKRERSDVAQAYESQFEDASFGDIDVSDMMQAASLKPRSRLAAAQERSGASPSAQRTQNMLRDDEEGDIIF